MPKVTVTVDVRGRTVALDQVSDQAVVRAFSDLGESVGEMLDSTACPEHGTYATDVRMHVAESGAADLQYESCCTKLRDAIGRALG